VPISTAATTGELGPAAAIDPDATAVPSPGLSLGAGRAAALVGQSYTPVGVHIARVALAIIGGAVNGAGVIVAAIPIAAVATAVPTSTAAPIPVAATVTAGELGTASAVDPDAVATPAPGLSLDAGRAAALIGHANSTAGIHIATVAVAIIGGAVDSLSVSLGRFKGQQTGKETEKSK